MPTLPSLSDAFSALGKSLKVPPASTFSFGSSGSTPAVPSPFSFAAPKQNVSPLMSVQKPVVPNMSFANPAPNMSTPTGPKYAPPPVIPRISTQTIASSISNTQPQGGGAPAQPSLSGGYSPSPYVTTPSGATVDPNTGSLISPATSGYTTAASAGGLSLGGNTANMQGGGSSPAVPSFSNNPLISNPQYEQAYSAYQAAATPSQQEIQAMTDKANLDASLRMAYANTENQPIALEFQTGQKAAEQRSYNALSAPLEATLATAQAKRQLAMTASQTALQRESDKLAAARDLAKPISTSYGGTLSRYNPNTGQYETVVNPFGTASGGGGANTTDVIGQAIADGRLSADQVTRYGIPFIASTLQSDPGYNFITQKASVGADTSSLKTQQSYADTVSRSFSTAQDNLKNIVGFMQKAGINAGSNAPFINDLQNAIKGKLVDPGTIAAFQSALQGLRSEYAQVLARGGEVTDNARNSAAALIPDNITAAQLQQVAAQLNNEGTNAIKEANQKVTDIQTRLKSNTGSSGSSGSKSASGGAANEGWF